VLPIELSKSMRKPAKETDLMQKLQFCFGASEMDDIESSECCSSREELV